MSEAPEKVWVEFRDQFVDIARWSDVRGGVEYIRADVSAARIADLERQLAEARTDAEQAVAVVVRKAVEACQGMDPEGDILALAPADALSEVERMRETLQWYGEQARLCRLIHSEGDAGRKALNDDGGQRARAALKGDTP